MNHVCKLYGRGSEDPIDYKNVGPWAQANPLSDTDDKILQEYKEENEKYEQNEKYKVNIPQFAKDIPKPTAPEELRTLPEKGKSEKWDMNASQEDPESSRLSDGIQSCFSLSSIIGYVVLSGACFLPQIKKSRTYKTLCAVGLSIFWALRNVTYHPWRTITSIYYA